MESCAQEAPRRGCVYSPTGFRRLTPALIDVDRAAERFARLPEGVTAPGQLLAAFKSAAPRLGLSIRLVHAVDWLFKFTQPQDWERGGRPIVWPSALLQQEMLGLSESQVKRLNRRLIEIGLVAMKDSPNGKRYGRRDPKGRIVEAYGFDLSPLGARYEEFVRLAEEGRAEREAMGHLRRRATIARKGIVQILEAVREYNFSGEEWDMLGRASQAIALALRRAERLDEMEAGVASLEQRQREARARLETLLEGVKKSPSQVENEPHQYIYNQTPNPLTDTVTAPNTNNRADEPVRPRSLEPEVQNKPEKRVVQGIRPDELVRLAPQLKSYLFAPSPTWPEIVDAADWLRHDLEVSKTLWGDACATLGRGTAAIALAIVSTKKPEHFRATPGRYFHGMVQKAKAGELHLERTLWALRRAAQPVQTPRSGQERCRQRRDRR